MGLILRILIYLYLYAGMQCVHQISWLRCQFIDEHVSVNSEGHTVTELRHREAKLQFGQKEDTPINPNAITFLVIGSKLEMRRYLEGVEADQLKCEIRRYSTAGIHVRWPVKGTKEYNRWFTCTLKHIKGLFTVTSFLRHPSDQPPSGRPDYHSWSPISNTEMLITTVTMVMITQSPSVKVELRSQTKLHCQFFLDHKAPNVTVEWHWQHHGTRTQLFKHNSRSGQSQGTGVRLTSLIEGDASYTLLSSEMGSEGTYVCSVSVMPLSASLDIKLYVKEHPQVSLNIGPTLSLQEGSVKKVVCAAERFYPLDVEITWYQHDPAVSGQRPPPAKVLQELSSHKSNPDKTFSSSAYFYLEALVGVSGRLFTCSVSHESLNEPIRKSFTLHVKEPINWRFYVVFIMVVLLLLYLGMKLVYWSLDIRRRKKYTEQP
ncbi:tapasin-related protein-like isoform X2 [Scomber scombrus]|uniref:tapasin-related protein-like isoform X2 n=1 Tax=Scomber scombrus TaxID=13677 RepID=UPI002DD8175F|nr:tapasin-related protein-like isoform X2 [Scomber scombrus]